MTLIANKPLVIYHSHCLDGMTAAWVFYQQFGDTMEYIPGVYQSPPPDVTGKDVYLVDFSYKRAVVEEMLKTARNVVLIDHHKSALEDLEGLEADNFDTQGSSLQHSGAMLAWLAICKMDGVDIEPPMNLCRVEDRDLWKFELEGTKEICAYLYHKLDTQKPILKMLSEWSDYMYPSTSQQTAMYVVGEALVEHNTKLAQGALRYARLMTISEELVLVANCMPFASSEVGNMLAEGNLFGATYVDMPDCRNFSLRSIGDKCDVSEIAKRFGGGGHKNASGFKVPRDHYLAKC